MAISDYQSLLLPILGQAKDRNEYRVRDVTETSGKRLGQSDREFGKLIQGGRQPIFCNRVHWVSTWLGVALLFINLCSLFITEALAQSTASCTTIKSDKDRLACFDAANKTNGKEKLRDEAAMKKATKYIRGQLKNPQAAKFGAATRSMRSNGGSTMDVVCGSVNGMGYYYWVEKDDGGIDDGSMAGNIGYEMWCRDGYKLSPLPRMPSR